MLKRNANAADLKTVCCSLCILPYIQPNPEGFEITLPSLYHRSVKIIQQRKALSDCLRLS